MPIFPTTLTLAGARAINRLGLPAQQEDLGGKIEYLLSAVNALISAVSALNMAATSAAGSGVTWSAFSAGTSLASYTGGHSNFRLV